MTFTRRHLAGYAAAAAVPGAGLLLRLAITAWTGPDLAAYITFYPAVMVVALRAGLLPGLAATAVSALMADYWVLPPAGFGIENAAELVGQVLFCLMGLFMSVVAHTYRLGRAKSAAYDREMALKEERQRLLARVEEERDRLTALVNSITDEIWFADAQRNFTLVNPAAARAFGLASGEAEGVERLAANLEVLRPDGTPRPVDEAPPLRALLGEVVKGQEEIVRIPATGELRHRQVSAAPVRGAEGAIVGSVSVVRDITALKRAAAEVERYSLQRQIALDAARMGCWHYDPNARLSDGDDRCRKILGASGPPGPIDELLARIIHPDDRAALQAKVEAALDPANPIPYAAEYRIRRPDGAERWIEAHGLAVFEGQGRERRAAGLVGTVVDVTARKEAEEALRRSEDRLKNAQALAHLGSWILDLTTNELTWSDEVYRIFGLVPQEFDATYEAFLERVHPEDRAGVDAAYSRSLEEAMDSYDIEHRVVRKNTGEMRFVHERCYHVRDASGAVLRSIGMVHDITERRQAEEALRETTAYLESLFAYANAPIICWDPGFRITRFNPAFERLTGIPVREALDGRLDILFPPATRQESMDRIREALSGERWEAAEIPIQHRDGDVRTVLWNSANVYGPDGRTVIATIAQGQDITLRRRAEEDLRRSNENLEQFAYVASHDLQEPLRMMASYSELLARRYADRLDTDADEFIGYIVDGAQRMQQLITDLLAYSRVGRSGHPAGAVDAGAVLDRALAGLQSALEESGGAVDRDPLPTVTAPETPLLQLFQNLIGNALKFRGPEPPRIRVSARREADAWEFTVADNGIGIAPRYQDRIFLIFQRLHGRGDYPGTGIGLAICKKIVETWGGRIWVDSEPGRGSAFHFTLPAKEAHDER